MLRLMSSKDNMVTSLGIRHQQETPYYSKAAQPLKLKARSLSRSHNWRVAVLEEQQIELKSQTRRLRKQDSRNNLHIRGIPRGVASEDIMAFTPALLQTIRGNMDLPPPNRDQVHTVASAPGCPDTALAILTRVHFVTEDDILQASRRKADLVFQGHTIQL
ncbi:hypothetical protein NDU88_003056 [Pleurodeles waltl]|uniref:Uncharacterized protein n=1 Tax=Pleurodeles waltl TaxID=8319 RepID=A0AAV7L0S2_PLEWA|nr:hypothetical protein NDU88_003056 [Pleurodeles waltl]